MCSVLVCGGEDSAKDMTTARPPFFVVGATFEVQVRLMYVVG